MPELSRFLGVIICMYFNDHQPPHFHAIYNEDKAAISIGNFSVLEGQLPPRVLGLVIEWAQAHQQELLDDWQSIQKDGTFHKIAPLV